MSTRALDLAEEIRQTGRRSPQELVPLIDQAERMAHDASDPFTRGVSVRAAGSAHQMLNNFTAALERYDSALACFNEAGDSAQVGRTLLAKVSPLAYLGKLSELFECAKDARRLFEAQGDEASLARLNVNLGNAYTRQDYLHEALTCYEQAFPMLEQLGDHEALIAASMNAAVVLTSLHRFDDAVRRYQHAAAIAHERACTCWISSAGTTRPTWTISGETAAAPSTDSGHYGMNSNASPTIGMFASAG